MKKVISLLLVLCMVFALCACGAKEEAPAAAPAEDAAAPAVDDKVYTLNFYHTFAGTGQEQEFILKAAEEISAQTNGKVVIEVVPDGTMGGEDETIPQVMSGSLAMSLSGPSVWGTNAGITALDWSEYPYVVTNYSEMNALGEILPDITNKQLEALGVEQLYCLGAMSQGIRCLCTIDPVNTMADAEGLKIRVPTSNVYESTVAAFGCSPTAMSSSQVITGLANKTIDGFESDPGSIIPRGQQESFKYYTETNHIASLNLLMINKGILESMPVEYQDVIKTVFKDICVQQCYDRVDYNNELTQVMIDAGVEVVTLAPEVFEAFKNAAYAFSAAQIEAEGVQEFVDEAYAYIAANAK